MMINNSYYMINMIREAQNATHMGASATRLGGIRGLRGHPDKCMCDTNAYLAIFFKRFCHPFGWHLSMWQNGWHFHKNAGFFAGKGGDQICQEQL